jgi:hypothetical protein
MHSLAKYLSHKKRVVRYRTGLKQLELCRDSFRQLNTERVYLLYIQETLPYAKQRCNWIVNKQVHTYTHYHRCAHRLELQNSKPSAAGCIFYNKLPNIKEICNNNQFKKELKEIFIKGLQAEGFML